MIDGLLRKFAKQDDSDDWSLEEEFEPEVDSSETLRMGPQSLIQTWPSARFSPNDLSPTDYYKGMVKAAIENGGECAGHHIPIPWLRMILAGLESKHVDPEALWQGVETDSPTDDVAYNALFPSEGAFLTGPR